MENPPFVNEFPIGKEDISIAMLDYRSVNMFHNKKYPKQTNSTPQTPKKIHHLLAELLANSPKSCVRCHRASPQKIRNQPAWPVVSEASPKTAPERAGFG